MMSSSRNAKSFQTVESMWWLCSSRVLRGKSTTTSLMFKPSPEIPSRAKACTGVLRIQMRLSAAGGDFAVFLVGVLAALAVAIEIARQHRLQGGGRHADVGQARIGAGDHIVGPQQLRLVGGDRRRHG